MKCEYGCGQDAKFILKNGKQCCSKSINSCPIIRAKNSKSQKKNYVFTIRAQFIKKECKWCNKEIAVCAIKAHEKSCYLNPKNIRLCPVCEKPIKRKKWVSVTCSKGCANTYFRSGENHPNYKSDADWKYREKAFSYYPNKCSNCGYNEHIELLDVHHIDGNRKHNKKENWIILCTICHAAITRNLAILENRKFKWLGSSNGKKVG